MGFWWSNRFVRNSVDSIANPAHSVVDFACGTEHISALTENGQLWTWGKVTGIFEPQSITLPSAYSNGLQVTWKKLAAGETFSMGLTTAGEVYVWGFMDKVLDLAGAQSSEENSATDGDESPSKKKGLLGRIASSGMVAVPERVSPRLFGNEKVVDISACGVRGLVVTDSKEFLAD